MFTLILLVTNMAQFSESKGGNYNDCMECRETVSYRID